MGKLYTVWLWIIYQFNVANFAGQLAEHNDLQIPAVGGLIALCLHSLQRGCTGSASAGVPVRHPGRPPAFDAGESAGVCANRGPREHGRRSLTQSEYVECREPFHLLKPHTCKVTERVKKEKEELLKELGDQINDSIKRTNSIYNTAIPNREFDEIKYDPKGVKYLEKFDKIRIPPADNDSPQQIVLKGTGQAPLLQ